MSLVGSLFELLAKVLANGLKKMVERVILNSQHTFVEDKLILDAVCMANEALNSRLKSFEKGSSTK